ncbi:hypothetical protein ACFQAT_28850 [Undibacterium arcticum]|uniref:Toxin co-regulated pilus biosynthesis protein Q C-terminal domain-containing protein n=1 Tax=Undibacterium arcticum TaxID=1762892 RepID=A0ABV7FAI9_9BURK
MKRTFLAIAITAVLSTSAQAAFTVDEDAPHITAVAPAPIPRQIEKAADISFDVTFVPSHSWINFGGTRVLKENVDEMKASDEIKIVTYRTANSNANIQKLRGQAIKNWLSTNGIPASKIVVTNEIETLAPSDPSANTAVVTLIQARISAPSYATTAPRYLKTSYVAPTASISATPSTPKPTDSTKSSGLIDDRMKLTLAQKIISMSQNKLIKPEDAVNMLAEILKMQDQIPASAREAVMTDPAPPLILVDLPRAWILDGKKTLHDNVQAWAKIAKWDLPVWSSTTAFQISDATLNGTFLDVIGQLANAVPTLDFKANRTMRTLSVQDARK